MTTKRAAIAAVCLTLAMVASAEQQRAGQPRQDGKPQPGRPTQDGRPTLQAAPPLPLEFDRDWAMREATEEGSFKIGRAAPPCGAEKRAEVLAPATASVTDVGLGCSLTLRPTDKITKRIIIWDSGVRLDCAGATIDGTFIYPLAARDTIQVRSRQRDGSWTPATDVWISNCRIIGSLRALSGLSEDDLKQWSRRADYVERIRAAAPQRITLTNLHITAIGRTAVYLHTGVSRVRLTHSVLDGQAESVAVYLDAETALNVIKNNDIRVASSGDREEIAVDGSSYNIIAGNRLSTLDTGGIYLYRNCGERGVVRHTGPRGNLIINNVFYYDRYTGSNRAINIGSRHGAEGYCDEDEDAPLGSGVDDRSYARSNVVLQNRIYKRSLIDMIRIGGATNTGNHVARFPEPGYNDTVASAAPRPSGCFRAKGYKRFFAHGETLDVYLDQGPRGIEPVCGREWTCDDGEWTEPRTSDCSIRKVTASCQRSNQNAGCDDYVGCASGGKIVGAYGACNLEGTVIGNGEIYGINSVPLNTFSVLRQSDNASDGWCQVGDNGIRTGNAPIDNVLGRSKAVIRCREQDKNGGDCKVQAVFYCR